MIPFETLGDEQTAMLFSSTIKGYARLTKVTDWETSGRDLYNGGRIVTLSIVEKTGCGIRYFDAPGRIQKGLTVCLRYVRGS